MLVLFVCMLCWSNAALAQTISTLADDGTRTNTSFDGQATATSTGNTEMRGLVVNTLGNIYFTDGWNPEIRKVNTSGVINVFAGAAQGLMRPWGLATDAANNVYRVCNQCNQVEKFAPSGGVPTRIAGLASDVGVADNGDGGLAGQARLNQGGEVNIDSAGNVFFLDLNNNLMRKITLTVPPAPTIASIEGMNGQLALRVALPVVDGGRTITSYTATCGAQSAASAVSITIVSGLTNGTTASY